MNAHVLLAHLSRSDKVSFCDQSLSVVVVLPLTIVLNDTPPKLHCILTKLGKNDPYMALFINCSNDSDPLHI